MEAGRWRTAVVLAFLLLAIHPPFFAGTLQAEREESGLSFSHSQHFEQGEIGCPTCHVFASESQDSADNLLPKEVACLSCHEREQGDKCLPCHANREAASPLKARAWSLHFSHSAHLSMRDLMVGFSGSADPETSEFERAETNVLEETSTICLACHAGMTSASSGSLENYPTMKRCLLCHEEKGDAMNHCDTCHPSAMDLLPTDHRADTFFDDHSSEGAKHDSETCEMCHTPGFNPCTQCH